MKVSTTRFGEIHIQEDDIVRFPQGILGFEQSQRFVLVAAEEHAPFAYLQSVDEGELAFIVVDPFEFFQEYEFELPESLMERLQIESSEQIIVRTIVSIKGEFEQATTNLVAPVVMNSSTRLGKQVVLTSMDYTTRHRLFAPDSVK